MKIFAICGNNKILRQDTINLIVKELSRRRYSVALWRQEEKSLPADSLPSGLNLLAQQTSVGSSLLWPHNFELDKLLPYVHDDFLLIDGYTPYAPHIICQDQENNNDEYDRELTLAIISNKVPEGTANMFQLPSDLSQLVDFLIAKVPPALPFPQGNPCCGDCNYADCAGLMRAIIKGEASHSNCVLLENHVEVKINGYSLPMVKFAENIVEQTLRGVLSTLDGYEKNCNIEVIIKEQDK
jgi:hypothetical protein